MDNIVKLEQQSLNYNKIIQKRDAICSFAIEKTEWFKKNIKTPFIWSDVPETKKIDLRNFGNQMIDHENDSKPLEFITSGSSGIPTKTYWSAAEYNRSTYEVWKARLSHGANKNDRIIYFNGLLNDDQTELITKNKDSTFTFLRDFSELATRTYCLFLTNCIGAILYGSASTIYNFCISIIKFNIMPPVINCIELNGEMVEEYERILIERVLTKNILNNYGAREMWPIAFECSCRKLHVCNDLVYMENNIANELLVTSLIKKYQPLIKYNIGDVGSVQWYSCSCGVESQIIVDLIGRKNDYIYLMNGAKIHWAVLSREINKFICNRGRSILEYSVIQKIDYSIEIMIVVDSMYDFIIGKELIQLVSHSCDNIAITINIVESVPQTSRGKRIYLQSELCDNKKDEVDTCLK